MFRYVILLAVVAGGFGAAVTEEKKALQAEGRIIGGIPSLISNFPYIVSIQSQGFHICAGVIVKLNTILTTAHCVIQRPANTLQIRAGSSYWNQQGVLMRVAAIRINERYNAKTVENNLAVLLLRDSLRPSSTIQPITLAGWEPPAGTAARIPGWGQFAPGSQLALHLSVANVAIILRHQCQSNLWSGYGNRIKWDMICAAAPGVGPCNGDDGGPLIINNILVGIASFGTGCALPNYPAVYVSVAQQRNWIEVAARWTK